MLGLITTILAVIGGITVFLVLIPLFGYLIIPVLLIVALIGFPILIGILIGRFTAKKGEDKKE